MDHGEKNAFAIPLSIVQQVVTQGKNEVALEFHQDDLGSQRGDHCLVEMRVYVPPNEDLSGSEEDEREDAVTVFRNRIKSNLSGGMYYIHCSSYLVSLLSLSL